MHRQGACSGFLVITDRVDKHLESKMMSKGEIGQDIPESLPMMNPPRVLHLSIRSTHMVYVHSCVNKLKCSFIHLNSAAM